MTSNSGHWTRDDLPSVIKWKSYAGMYLSRLRELEEYVDATLDHLNAHYPKPQPYDQGGVRGADSLLYRAERERDAAVARAEQAEKRHTWPKVAPTGHTYVEPRTYEALRHEHDNAAQAAVESWDADECPPEPTWEMVGIAHREVERLQRECDEMRPSYDESVSMAYWAAKRLGCHVDDLDDLTLTEMAERVAAQPAPAVTRDDIGNALMRVGVSNSLETHVEVSRGTDAVWSLVSGDDPAVYVVRESDIAAVEATYGVRGWEARGLTYGESGPKAMRSHVQRHLKDAAGCEAVARAIEAEQAVDPVEALAEKIETATRAAIRQACDDLADVAPSLDPLAVEQAMEVTAASRKVAAHVLGQEADDE